MAPLSLLSSLLSDFSTCYTSILVLRIKRRPGRGRRRQRRDEGKREEGDLGSLRKILFKKRESERN